MQQSDEESGWNGENGTPSEGESLTSRRGFTSEPHQNPNTVGGHKSTILK